MMPIKWTIEIDSILGTMSDRLAAKTINCSILSIQKRRYKLDIAPHRKHSKSALQPETIDLLGTMPDVKTSKITSESVYIIRRIRIKLGIPIYRANGLHPLPHTKIDRNKEVHRMRKSGMTLQAIADKFEVRKQCINTIIKRGY